jgi:hypothetical protein
MIESSNLPRLILMSDIIFMGYRRPSGQSLLKRRNFVDIARTSQDYSPKNFKLQSTKEVLVCCTSLYCTELRTEAYDYHAHYKT